MSGSDYILIKWVANQLIGISDKVINYRVIGSVELIMDFLYSI